MKAQIRQMRITRFLALITALSFGISAPALWAQDDSSSEHPSGHPHGNIIANTMSAPLEEAWVTVKQSVPDMDTAVQSKNLHGVHVATVKINPAITKLEDHSIMVKEEKAQNLLIALHQLRHCVIKVHRAALDKNQAEAEAEIKNVDNAFHEVEAQDPESTLKGH
jgi:hypothetical protein